MHFLDDDRVICLNCSNACKVEASEFVALKKAKELKARGQRVGMVGDKRTVVGKWVKLSWLEWQCQALGISTQPLDLPHRCHLFISKAVPASVQSDAWWQD